MLSLPSLCRTTEIAALSIGTGTVAWPWRQPGDEPSPFLAQPTKQGLVADLKKIAASILDDPPDFATFLSHVVTGAARGLPAPLKSRIVRMNPLISPVKNEAGAWVPPRGMTEAQFLDLAALDFDAVEPDEVEAIADYDSLWRANQAPNQPVRMNGDTLACEIGDPWFADAVAHWRALKPLF